MKRLLSDQNRREFLRNAFRLAGGGAAGLAAIQGLGLSAVEDAGAWGLLPALVSGGGGSGGGINTSLATWDQVTESGWGDSAHVNICILNALSAGSNETSVGVTSGIKLIFTQNGNIAGALLDGVYYYRQIDNSDDWFAINQGWFNDIFYGSSSWTLMLKFRQRQSGESYLVVFDNNSADPRLYFWNPSTNHARVMLTDSVGQEIIETTAAITVDGSKVTYMAAWSDGVYTRMGFKEGGGPPTKWSDFPAANRAQFSRTFTFGQMGVSPSYYGIWGAGGVRMKTTDAYWSIAAKTCLIDNNS